MCMEEEQEKAPQLQQAPAPPTAAQLTDDAIASQGKIFNASLPQIGTLGQELMNVQSKLLPQANQLSLDQKRIFGPALVGLAMDMAKQADPSGFQLRDSLVSQVTKNLAQGGMLTPEEQRLAQEDVRSGQANRGFGTGMSDVYDEARFLGNQRFGREQARISNALQVLAGRDPGQAFMGISQGTQEAQAPNMSGFAGQMIPGAGNFMGLGNQVWQNQANANAMNNEVNFTNWENNLEPQSGGLMGAFSGGMAGASAGSALGPWGALGGGIIGAVGGGLAKKQRQ